jgi:hypothetical protein
MNFEYYIFEKVGKVYTQEPNESFVAEVISKSEKLSVGKDCFVTHRDGSLLYYIVFIHGAKKEYRGICIALNGVYALSPIDLLKKIRQKRDKKSPLIREDIGEIIEGVKWGVLPASDLSLSQDKMREFQSCGELGILEATVQYPYVLIYCDKSVKESGDVKTVEVEKKPVGDANKLEESGVAEHEQENVKEEQIAVVDKFFEKVIDKENQSEGNSTQDVEEENGLVKPQEHIKDADKKNGIKEPKKGVDKAPAPVPEPSPPPPPEPTSHGGISISIILSTLIALGIILYKKEVYEERNKKALTEHREKEKIKLDSLVLELNKINQSTDSENEQKKNELSKFKKDANEYIKRDVKNMDVKALDSLLNFCEESMKENDEDKELERIKGKLETHKAQRKAYEAKLKIK